MKVATPTLPIRIMMVPSDLLPSPCHIKLGVLKIDA
jgi:hypothetical protein